MQVLYVKFYIKMIFYFIKAQKERNGGLWGSAVPFRLCRRGAKTMCLGVYYVKE